MAPVFLQLEGITRENRHEMTSRLESAISGGGGWVLDFHLFSNRAVTFRFAVPSDSLPRFVQALLGTGLSFVQESQAALEACAQPLEETSREVPGTLRVTFLHSEPDLKREVPPFE